MHAHVYPCCRVRRLSRIFYYSRACLSIFYFSIQLELCNLVKGAMSSQIYQITNKPALQKVEAESSSVPTIIYVSNSALPICRDFTPKYEELAQKYSKDNGDEKSIRFTQIEFATETSALFKFSPNQLPVVTFLCKGPWSKTLMSPSVQQMEQSIEEMLQKAGKWKN